MFKIISVTLILVYIITKYFCIVKVDGNSMYPTYKDGNILLAYRIPRNKVLDSLEVNKVYVYTRVCEGETYCVIKRLTEINKNALFFEGDNKAESIDSRTYGYVSTNRLVAKILFKII